MTHGKVVTVWSKDASGQWKNVIDMWNDPPVLDRSASMTSDRLPMWEPGTSRYIGVGLVVVLLGGFAREARAQVEQPAGPPLGLVDFPITCSEPAQVGFNRAVALLHHMTYPRAREAFQQIATTDPGCAMAPWGIAMTLFQPLWPTRPRAQELQRGWEAVQRAKFARNIRLLRLELNAWVAQVEGQREFRVALMREAAELEASTPKHAVTPGPTLPAQELLGDLLMEQNQPTEALAAYRRSMVLCPKRFNGLLGAARAARAFGDATLARTFYQELLDVAGGGTRQPALKEARTYLARPER